MLKKFKKFQGSQKYKKYILITTITIASFIIFASPIRIIWNSVEAVVRTTLISQTGRTLIANNPKGYPGSGWVRNLTGSGSTVLNKANCDAVGVSEWAWFEDGNGDGDTVDPEDGVCIQTAATTASLLSWNGAEQIATTSITAQSATAGSANTITLASAGWLVDKYANMVVKITSGTASTCWGVVKSNTSDTITVYGSWLSTTYASSCGTPDDTSVFSVLRDGFADYDNSWIGDWTCTGNFPSGTVVWGSYPSAGGQAGSGAIAHAKTDCYDGKRDLLPREIDRAVRSGTATGADATTITDSSLVMEQNEWVGQKVLITSGTGSGGYGRIESNTATVITVGEWTGGTPAIGSVFKIIYLIPHASYNITSDVDGDDNDELRGNNGPLDPKALAEWKGTRLPTSSDFFGYCGYKDGGANYETTYNATSSNKSFGIYGGQVGRTDEFIDLGNYGSYEWLSEQFNYYYARIAGFDACSNINNNNVNNGNRFRAIFRP